MDGVPINHQIRTNQNMSVWKMDWQANIKWKIINTPRN